ncbi:MULTISPECIES: phenylalanine 4-monooxygenase [unclassified Hahella]|uniref:phenylalanine 4-monooxygenase n=1 Tax=unclassified Hahella TaxID=2624107 RepID=UPI001C1EA06E|nr:MULTISPECIES: phenylalanine 4-monooxygenase [unclassified Hahella]MBU6951517.1 phenylalanine 4-monooxygenase [Hahella sp. HN01]MDG9669092.1 phenylalanine 4-monooxygenase [Hahella sp. CR1]
MGKGTKYVAREPDASGFIAYPDSEHAVWRELITRQDKVIRNVACDEYLHGLKLLDLPEDRIPQLEDVSSVLRRETGWEVAQVPALIPFDTFFDLLSNKKFPCATFIRTPDEMDYLQEPDIFHEIFGHCAMLTNPYFAEFTQMYGKLGYSASKEDRIFLARLYWFTVEFGLMDSAAGQRIYGGGILSSIGETQYCFSDTPERRPFDIVDVLRTPYRIDIMQPIYYVLDGLKQLYEVAHCDIMDKVRQAKELGLFAPTFPPKQQSNTEKLAAGA